MRHHGHQSSEQRVASSALLKLLGKRLPLLRGSLVTMKRKCGKESCRCVRGQKHVSLYLAARVGGKRKMIFVPGDLEEKVRLWVRQGRETEKRLDALSEASTEAFLKEKEKRAAVRGKKKQSRRKRQEK